MRFNKSLLVLFASVAIICSLTTILVGCSQEDNAEPKFDDNITKEDLSNALGIDVNDETEPTKISQGEYNYPVNTDELDGKASKTIKINDEKAFKKFVSDVEKGDFDDKIVCIEGYSAAFNHRHYISVQNAGEGDTNVIMPESYVGIPYEINGTDDADYPANAQKIKITGKIMQNPAAPKVKVLITLPKYIEEIGSTQQ